jgi:hypothetical protein
MSLVFHLWEAESSDEWITQRWVKIGLDKGPVLVPWSAGKITYNNSYKRIKSK